MKLAEHIKGQLDIVAVVTDCGIRLTKRGRDHIGLCPFHSEKSPSFSVNPKDQFFHCFGCGKSGDLISFVQSVDECSFQAALDTLVARYSIRLPERAYKNKIREAIRELERQGRIDEAVRLVEFLSTRKSS